MAPFLTKKHLTKRKGSSRFKGTKLLRNLKKIKKKEIPNKV